MNRIYRSIWNENSATFVAVSENAKSGAKNSSPVATAASGGTRFALKALRISLLMAFGSSAYALPTGGDISAGGASIANGTGSTTINQTTPNVVINWKSFNIGQGESVRFVQPGSSSVALNRVLGSDPSSILGSLTANGKVFLINPNGILFGKSASVNVGGLVASTLNITDGDFMAGRYRFSGAGRGSVLNQGSIAATGGYVALLGANVSNEGTISARLGTVALAAGNAVTLDVAGDGLLNVTVNQGAVNALAQNGGLIRADGGQVLLTAQAAGNLLQSAVNNSGVIQAQTIENRNGVIRLLGDMQSGTVNVGGKLDASAPNGGNGGFIDTSAAQVKIASDTKVTTSAALGRTGNWLIDPTDFTIAAGSGAQTGSSIGADTLSSNLAGSNINIATVASGPENGDIHVHSAVSWSGNTLTLTAHGDININASLNGSGTAKLALQYGQGAVAVGNTSTVKVNAPVNLPAGNNFSTTLGSDGALVSYTVINSLGAAGSVTGVDLQGMNGGVAANYALGSDIDASATLTWNALAGFMPIGAFTGRFDGLGHTISNLTINRPATNNVGLFGSSLGATISNVTLAGASVTGSNSVGALVGNSNSTSIINASSTTGNVTGVGAIGGLVGSNQAASVIANSFASGSVTGSAAQIGGLVGVNFGTVRDSYNTGTVSGGAGTGGLIGVNEAGGTVDNNYNTGNVSGGAGTGGLIGTNGAGNAVSDSYSTGSVTGAAGTGGLVGDNTTGAISNSYATGNVIGAAGTGGLVGGNTTGAITNNYATGNVIGAAGTGGLVGSSTTGPISASFATGTVTGDASTGGLVGSNTTGAISSSFATGAVSGAAGTGGLVGNNTSGSVSNSYATGSVSGADGTGGLIGSSTSGPITNTYATGHVSTTGTVVGGLIGSITSGVVTNSYWDFQTSGQLPPGTGTALTSTAMKQQTSFSTWDFGSTWTINVGVTNPLLRAFIRPLTVTANNDSRTYGGPAYSGGNGVTYSTPLNGITPAGTLSYGGTSQGATNAGSYVISPGGLQNDQHYQITFVDGALTVTQRAVTVTADAGQSKTYGNADPASYTYGNTSLGSGVALVGALDRAAGENVASYAIGAGTLTNANNPNYTLSYTGNNFAITQRPITLTATAASKTYGNADPAPGVTVTGGSLASVSVTDTLADVSGTVGRQAGETVAGGPYDITLGSGTKAANYAISFVANNNAFTIDQRAVSVTANAGQTKTYGNADPASYTYANSSLGSGVALVGALDRAAGENVADYAIGAGTLTNANNPNYTLSYTGDNFAITQRPITLAATAASKTYGNADPVLGVSITGGSLASVSVTDTLADVSGTVGRQAGETVAGGPYDITLGSGTKAANYAISFVADNNAFTIDQRAVTVTANAGQTKVYGNADPASYTYANSSLGSGVALAGALDRAAGENVADYAIGAGTLTNANNPNYTLSYTGDNFAITQRPITLTATPASKTYGNADPALGVSVTAGSLASVSVTDTLADVTGTVGRQAGETVAGGPYDITLGSGAKAANYAISFVADNNAFSIGQRAVTVTADPNQTKTYGNADPASYTYGNTSLGTGVALVGALDRAAGENVASYAIGAGTLTNANNPNYTLSYTGDNFAITQRPITLTATPASKTYGNADPALGVSITAGSLASVSVTDTLAEVTGTVGRQAGETVAGGPYDITLGSGTKAANYAISFVADNNAFSIGQRAVTLTATPASKTYGNADPALGVTVTGGSLASVSVTDTLADVTGTVGRQAGETVAGGPYDITLGSGTKAANYAISFVADNNAFSIGQRAVTVTADAGQTKVYGNADPASYTYANSSLGSGVALTGALDRAAGENVASYAIGAGTLTNANNPNYTLSYTGDNFAITQRPITLAATPASKPYGNADPTLGVSVTAGSLASVSVTDTLAEVTGTVGRQAGETVAGGPHDITLGSGTKAANYTISFVADNNAFSIGQRALTVTASDVLKSYGETPTLSGFTATGLQNVETIGSVSQSSAGAAATAGVAGSPYAITASAASGGTFDAANYNISYVAGALTVVPATLTVTANPTSMIFGAAIPPLSGAISGFVNGETQAGATTGTLSFSTTASSASAAGSYPIDGSGLTPNANYVITAAAGNATALTINPVIAPAVPPAVATTTLTTVDPGYQGAIASAYSQNPIIACEGNEIDSAACHSSNRSLSGLNLTVIDQGVRMPIGVKAVGSGRSELP